MVLLADAVSKHEQRRRQAERQRVEERAELGRDQRNGMRGRISIPAANTTQREDNTPKGLGHFQQRLFIMPIPRLNYLIPLTLTLL